MKLLIALAWLFWFFGGGDASAIVEPPPEDESKPELVKLYLFMPCETLEVSYAFQYQQLEHLIDHLERCNKASEDNPDYEYGPLMCLYVKMQWQYMYDHISSVEKAYQLMCDDVGYPKNPQYEIDF